MKIAILCGGKGKRLMPYTEEVPKVLVPLNGKPILEHILGLYLGKNYNDFILCVGYKGAKVREFVDNAMYERGLPYKVEYSEAGEEASMLTRIFTLKGCFSDRILISYGDTLTDLDIGRLQQYHQEKGSALTIVSARIQSPFGLVTNDEDGMVSSFDEKPVFYYYIGHMLLEERAFGYITSDMLERPDGDGLVAFFKTMIEKKLLYVYHYTGKQITFNTHSERQQAEEMIQFFYTLDETT
jgi:glucose-1-phosphate cytidylyltransferase